MKGQFFGSFSIHVSMIPFLHDLLHLFYPEVCAACGNALFAGEHALCTVCRALLPRTGFEMHRSNPVEKQFWGKVPVHSAASLYYFHKGSKVQHLIHRLKYKGEVEAGREAGRILGAALARSPLFEGIHCVVPVPLHKSRLRTRGYNQSEPVAEGVAESMGIPTSSKVLARVKAAVSQTSKGRYARWENAGSSFVVAEPQSVTGKHFLVVDDVITTGSTLSACADVLLASGASAVSLASLAFAGR